VFKFFTYDPHNHAAARIFKSKIVNKVKGKITEAPYEKLRLVV
jgi:hypothetical protein